jgi:hypothetical protein
MELTEGFETSANHNMTPGKYPKEYTQENISLFYQGTQTCLRPYCLLQDTQTFSFNFS